MRGEQQAWNQGRDERPGAVRGPRAAPSGTPVLPSWGSFPAEDRHRLVGALLRAARRRVETGPASSRAMT
jgi:hypothetical protein